jgi:hypothetical protein
MSKCDESKEEGWGEVFFNAPDHGYDDLLVRKLYVKDFFSPLGK